MTHGSIRHRGSPDWRRGFRIFDDSGERRMKQLTVHLQDQDHLIGEDETTVCGIPVPHGTATVDEATSPCPVCFPDAVVSDEPKAEPKKRGRPKGSGNKA